MYWHVDFLRTKDEFPDKLEDFLDSANYQEHQLYTDNEKVLNSTEACIHFSWATRAPNTAMCSRSSMGRERGR